MYMITQLRLYMLDTIQVMWEVMFTDQLLFTEQAGITGPGMERITIRVRLPGDLESTIILILAGDFHLEWDLADLIYGWDMDGILTITVDIGEQQDIVQATTMDTDPDIMLDDEMHTEEICIVIKIKRTETFIIKKKT